MPTGEQISTYEEHTDKEIGRTLETAVETFHTVVRDYFRAVHHISASQPPKLGICDGPAVKSHARPYQSDRGAESPGWLDPPGLAAVFALCTAGSERSERLNTKRRFNEVSLLESETADYGSYRTE